MNGQSPISEKSEETGQVKIQKENEYRSKTHLKGYCHHFYHDFVNLKNIYRSLEAEQ